MTKTMLFATAALALALATPAFAQSAPANAGCVKGATLAGAGGTESPKLAGAGGTESPKLASAQPCP